MLSESEFLSFVPPTHKFGTHPHLLARDPAIFSILPSAAGFNGCFYEFQELAARIIPYFPSILIMYPPGTGKTGAIISSINAILNTRRFENIIIITRNKVQDDVRKDLRFMLDVDQRLFSNRQKETVMSRLDRMPMIKMMTYDGFNKSYNDTSDLARLKRSAIFVDEPQNILADLAKEAEEGTVLRTLSLAQQQPNCGITVFAVTNTPMVDDANDLRALGMMLLTQHYVGQMHELNVLLNDMTALAKRITELVPIMWKEGKTGAKFNPQLSGIYSDVTFGAHRLDQEMYIIEMSEEQRAQYIAHATAAGDFRLAQRQISLHVQDIPRSAISLSRWSPIMAHIIENEEAAYRRGDIGVGFVYFADMVTWGTNVFRDMLIEAGWVDMTSAESIRNLPQEREDVIPDPVKTFAVFTGDTGPNTTFMKIKSPTNVRGGIVRLIIVSKAFGEGVSFMHATRIYKPVSEWNRTREVQSDARTMRATSHDVVRAVLTSDWLVTHPSDRQYIDETGTIRPKIWRYCSYLSSHKDYSVDVDMWYKRHEKEARISEIYKILTDAAFDKVVAECASSVTVPQVPLCRMEKAAHNYVQRHVRQAAEFFDVADAHPDPTFQSFMLRDARYSWMSWFQHGTPNMSYPIRLPYRIIGTQVHAIDPMIPAPLSARQANYSRNYISDFRGCSTSDIVARIRTRPHDYRSAITRAAFRRGHDEIDVSVAYTLMNFWWISTISGRGRASPSFVFFYPLTIDCSDTPGPVLCDDILSTLVNTFPRSEAFLPPIDYATMMACVADHAARPTLPLVLTPVSRTTR